MRVGTNRYRRFDACREGGIDPCSGRGVPTGTTPGPSPPDGIAAERRAAAHQVSVHPYDRDAVRDRCGAVGSTIPGVGHRSDVTRTAPPSSPGRPPHLGSGPRCASICAGSSTSDRRSECAIADSNELRSDPARRPSCGGTPSCRTVHEEVTRMRAASNPSTMTPRRSRWVWIAIGVVVVAVIGVIAYMAVYNGGGGGTGGGGYFILAFSGDQVRRLGNRVLSRR
jgi:hypothetical protein